MERDRNDAEFNATTGQSAGGTGGMSQAAGDQAGSPGGQGMGGGAAGQGITDRARDLAGSAQDRLADIGSTVREKTGGAKDALADALESGADRLRQRSGAASGGSQMAGATAEGGSVATGDGRVAQISDRLASGMDATADWLREADLDTLRLAVERQVREHPGRTLLIAAGLGYLIGKAFRGNR